MFRRTYLRLMSGTIVGMFTVLLIFIILFYGPFEQFRVLWINTAMYTSNHKWLATTFYSQEYINKVINDNTVYTDKSTDSSFIDSWQDDNIIFTEVKGKYYQGYIIKVNNPTRLTLSITNNPNGELLEEFIFNNDAIGGVNAGGYVSDKSRGIPWGFCIKDGDIINKCDDTCIKHTLGGMNSQNKLIVGSFTNEEIITQDFQWAVEFNPILIVNGEKTDIKVSAGGLAPRTAIGQTKEGAVLLLIIDGRQFSSIGGSYLDLQTILYSNGAVNAIALDGGASTSMVFNGVLINSPSDGEAERMLPNAIIFN